jgi:hypothetical protein
MNEKVNYIFEKNPSSKYLYATTDGMVFHAFPSASAHGRSLKDDTVKEFTRDGKSKKIDVLPNDLMPTSKAQFYDASNDLPDVPERKGQKAVEEMTVAQVGKWAADQTSVDELLAALELVTFVGAKAHIAARLAEINPPNEPGLDEKTIEEVEAWAAEQAEVEPLAAALEETQTEERKAILQARINELKKAV